MITVLTQLHSRGHSGSRPSRARPRCILRQAEETGGKGEGKGRERGKEGQEGRWRMEREREREGERGGRGKGRGEGERGRGRGGKVEDERGVHVYVHSS